MRPIGGNAAILTALLAVSAVAGELRVNAFDINAPRASDVDYGSFACRDTMRDLVEEFFAAHPPDPVLGWCACHNDCAILEEFPSRPLPRMGPILVGAGYIAIHVLANAEGVPVYARALNGHPWLRRILEFRACEAKFRTHGAYRQRVIQVCPNDDCRGAFQPVR